MTKHKFNKTKFEGRKSARIELKKPHSKPKAIAEIVARLKNIEKILGI